METSKESYHPNPRETANPFSVAIFGYTFSIFKKGYSKNLEIQDLYNPLKTDRSKHLGNKLQTNWDYQLEKAAKSKTKPSFARALASTFWIEYVYLGVNTFIGDLVIALIQPIVLGWLLEFFSPNSTVTLDDALLYAGIIVACNFIRNLMGSQYMLKAVHEGMRLRVSCCSLIYRKSLKLSKTALGDTASGKIVNLLSSDVSRFDYMSHFLHQMWLSPLSALIIMGLLYNDAGYAGIVGIFAVFAIVLLQAYTGKLSAKYRKQTASKTDERVRLMDEILSGIQVIKMYAWEIPFRNVIKAVRKAEINIITKSSFVRATYMTFNLMTTRVALFSSLLTLVLSDQVVTASRVFVFMSYFNMLSNSIGAMFIRGLSEIAELTVSLNRIQAFLLNEEYDPKQIESHQKENLKDEDDFRNAISIENLTAKWNVSYKDNALENINLNIPDGHLVGIIGPVGSGKSTLLQTILGELDIVRGDIAVRGKISYASQEAWVFGATVRQNILFGEEYDPKRYREVIKVCALETDFKQFENGDMSIVGDRGASLSGGQKARINLARAVYREADIYLLDDPLSAVDIHVSKHLYEKCINGYLANRTRILVTHQVHYLKNADNIIVLNNGHVEDEGTFNKLTKNENVYAQLLSTDPEAAATEEKVEKDEYFRQITEESRKASMSSLASKRSVPDDQSNDPEEVEDLLPKAEQMKMHQEESSRGKVKGSLLYQYMVEGSNICGVVLVIALFIVTLLGTILHDYWVSYWVNVEQFRHVSNVTTSSGPLKIPLVYFSMETCLYVYVTILISLLVIAMVRSFSYYKLAMSSSEKLHAVIYDNVVSAPMRFFDTIPSGGILNRFSKDIGTIDELLPRFILDAAQMLLLMAGSLILVVLVNPYFLIMIVILAVIFGFMSHVYLQSSKNIKRLEGMMRSPTFTHLKATIEGLTTIRAFSAQKNLTGEFDSHQDRHSSAWYLLLVTSSAYGFYLDAFCSIFLGLLTFSLISFGENFGLKGGEVGLAITQATALCGVIQWGIRQSAEVINQLMSVERVLEYKSIPKETAPANPKHPPEDWPQKGEIIFKDGCLRYFEGGPLVLKHLNLVMNPKEKIGVVGRTGAGKSSLIQALFKLAPTEGEILIDNIDISDLNSVDLRPKMSIIPQDPTLFSGTLRHNLDPFEEYTDDALYKAIEEVELKDPANVLNRLESRVMDRGSNYSVGQKQLICLARAILKKNRVLMLDEATANVDPQTDALIQKTIREKFSDCTVITVAHRLNTIMDSDKVLVLDDGQVVEYDHPHVLLHNQNGALYKMVKETGPVTSTQLFKMASNSYSKWFSPNE